MLSGILVMDKPSGMTSFQMVRAVRRRLEIRKVGHAGTLDPLATGILPICVGPATKIVQFLMAGHKVYEGTMILGVSTDTYDAAGRVTDRKPVPSGLDQVSLQKAVKDFTGRLLQAPPPFSAAKHQGKPLYKFARQGIIVHKKRRPVEVFSFEIIRVMLPEVDFRICCSKGTYVRSLVHDLGSKLSCGGHVKALRRTRNGHFESVHALSLKALDEFLAHNRLSDVLIPVKKALAHIPAVKIGNGMAKELRSGQPVLTNRLQELIEQQQDHELVPDLPYLRLLVCKPPNTDSDPDLLETDLVSIVAWPTKQEIGGQRALRPLKVWPKERPAVNRTRI